MDADAKAALALALATLLAAAVPETRPAGTPSPPAFYYPAPAYYPPGQCST